MKSNQVVRLVWANVISVGDALNRRGSRKVIYIGMVPIVMETVLFHFDFYRKPVVLGDEVVFPEPKECQAPLIQIGEMVVGFVETGPDGRLRSLSWCLASEYKACEAEVITNALDDELAARPEWEAGVVERHTKYQADLAIDLEVEMILVNREETRVREKAERAQRWLEKPPSIEYALLHGWVDVTPGNDPKHLQRILEREFPDEETGKMKPRRITKHRQPVPKAPRRFESRFAGV